MAIFTLGLWLTALVTAWFLIYKSLVRIPAEPPTVAVVTWFGRRVNRFKREGWRWFFLNPFVQGFILIDVTAKNQDLVPEEVFTPDNAQIEVEVSTTWRPLAHVRHSNLLLNYLNSGGEKRVSDIFEDMIAEAVREMARDKELPPQTWVEATEAGMRDRFAQFIIARLTGREFDDVSKDELDSLRVGNGSVVIAGLGITISRVNVTRISPSGVIVEAAQRKATEIAEAEAEKIETEAVAAMIKKYMKELEISAKEAAELVQSERKKIEKKVTVFKLDVSEEAERALPHVAKTAASIAAAAKPFIGGKSSGV